MHQDGGSGRRHAAAATPRRASSQPAGPSSRPAALGRHAATARHSHYLDGREHSLRASLFWTTAGAILPGLGLWPTKARRAGQFVLLLFLAAVLAVVAVGVVDLSWLLSAVVRPRALRLLGVGSLGVGIVLATMITWTHLLTRPRTPAVMQRLVGSTLVGLLTFVVTAPLIVGASHARSQAFLVNGVFKVGTRSITRPDLGGGDVWKNKARLNVLLLGADSTADRDRLDPEAGVRTDTVMLASIDTATGDMALVQLPRNMSTFTFPAASSLAKAYPDGYWDGQSRENPEYELNSVYKNVPATHPDLFTGTDYPGADALKIAVEGITGLKPDYFVMLSIDGLTELIDAMGGVDLNVNTRIPVGGNNDGKAATGWIEPGPHRHLNGYYAMWYARSRQNVTDSDRMARQGCVVKAVIEQANPQNILTRYEAIAQASTNAFVTDIPQDVAPAMVDLALRMKDGQRQRVLFAYPRTKYLDGSPFEPWDPDQAKMQQLVQQGIEKSTARASATPQPAQETGPAGQPTAPANPGTNPAATAPENPTPDEATPSSSSSARAAEVSLDDACAYDPSAVEG
ncbi:hypothetical protein GCM10027030_26210 [Luteococcus sediminum]